MEQNKWSGEKKRELRSVLETIILLKIFMVFFMEQGVVVNERKQGHKANISKTNHEAIYIYKLV